MKQHIEQHHGIRCERADAQVLTNPILDKINDFIWKADVIIADCSGRNPNVFYELGIAHAREKKVVLITNDSGEAPSDIRHYEFIHYELDKHTEFLKKLDNALHNVFSESYEGLYERARAIFNEFTQATHVQVQIASKETFMSCVMRAECTENLPSMDDDAGVEKFVLPKIIADSRDAAIMSQITKWLYEK
jgi:nucleoside 2-deoxyribosyltransferase